MSSRIRSSMSLGINLWRLNDDNDDDYDDYDVMIWRYVDDDMMMMIGWWWWWW